LKENLASLLLNGEAQARIKDNEPQIIDLSNISGIACSADGKDVYLTGQFFDSDEKISDRECMLISNNYGKPGSWQTVCFFL
jgi:hypothetical protein